jgi:hypothetical protein
MFYTVMGGGKCLYNGCNHIIAHMMLGVATAMFDVAYMGKRVWS